MARERITKGEFGAGRASPRASLIGVRVVIRKSSKSADTLTVGRKMLDEAPDVFRTGYVFFDVDPEAYLLYVKSANPADSNAYKINKPKEIGRDHKTLSLPKRIAKRLELKPGSYHFRQYAVLHDSNELMISIA